MAAPKPGEVTRLLIELSDGREDAVSALLPILYGELRRLAEHYLRRERPNHTLQATALVHEAYLRLIDQKQVRWQNRAHFCAVAAQAMRRVLVDHARARLGPRRGGALEKVSLDEAATISNQPAFDLLGLDEALTRLAAKDPRASRIVELRFFGGLTVEEVSAALDLSAATIKREWSFAKAWLHREMTGAGGVA